MKEYIIETLKEQNKYINRIITENEVQQVNELINFRNSLDNNTPQIGDIIEYRSNRGKIYNNAHIEKIQNGKIYLCEHPSIPFVNINDHYNSLLTSTSGGAWKWIYIEDLEELNLGIQEKTFCSFFGYAEANKVIYFNLQVKKWKYKEIRSNNEELFESCNDKRVNQILTEIKQTQPKNIYEALKIFKNAFNWDRCFTFSPMFEDEKHAYVELFNRYEIYCYCDYKNNTWSITDKRNKYKF